MDPFLTLGDEEAQKKLKGRKRCLRLLIYTMMLLMHQKTGHLQFSTYPHYMERKHKKSFHSTSILELIYDTVVDQNAEGPPPSEIKKLPCFEDELIPEFYMEQCRCWYERYKKEMNQALKTEKNDKNELANKVIQKYKQEFYGAAGFEDSKKSLEELYMQSLTLYNIAYDCATIKYKVRYCGFAWKVAGPVLCKFYLKKMEEKSISCSISVLKELWG